MYFSKLRTRPFGEKGRELKKAVSKLKRENSESPGMLLINWDEARVPYR